VQIGLIGTRRERFGIGVENAYAKSLMPLAARRKLTIWTFLKTFRKVVMKVVRNYEVEGKCC
jgi:hypothetical protein